MCLEMPGCVVDMICITKKLHNKQMKTVACKKRIPKVSLYFVLAEGGPHVQSAVKRPATTSAEPLPAKRVHTLTDACALCGEKVYLLERHMNGSKLFHRRCIREQQRTNTLTRARERAGSSTDDTTENSRLHAKQDVKHERPKSPKSPEIRAKSPKSPEIRTKSPKSPEIRAKSPKSPGPTTGVKSAGLLQAGPQALYEGSYSTC